MEDADITGFFSIRDLDEDKAFTDPFGPFSQNIQVQNLFEDGKSSSLTGELPFHLLTPSKFENVLLIFSIDSVAQGHLRLGETWQDAIKESLISKDKQAQKEPPAKITPPKMKKVEKKIEETQASTVQEKSPFVRKSKR